MKIQRITRELADYEVLPRIVCAGRRTNVTIRPLGDHAAFLQGETYTVRILPLEQNIQPRPVEEYPSASARAENGKLSFSHGFDGEQQFFLEVFREGVQEKVCSLRIYALLPDLFSMRPYRGDFHAHSNRSDGKEAPAIVAANYRKAGFDFMALTDHHSYSPSLEAIAAYAGQPVDLRLFPGEEVHAPDNHAHIVNFGGSFSLNDYFADHPEEYARQVTSIEEKLNVPPGVDRHEAAAFHWAFDKIREGGGLAIFPHPHWIFPVYHIPDVMSRYLFEARAFDAFELLGGQNASDNNMQVALYQQLSAQGITLPALGSSDSHGTVDANWFTWASSIVISPSLEWEDLRESVKALRSVAVEAYPGEQPRFYGEYRFVKYAMFLWDTYFALHDEMCFEEGRQMKALVTGDQEAAPMLRLMQGRSKRMLDRWFGAE